MKIKMALSLFLLAIIQNSFAAECSYDFNVNTYPVVSGKQYKFTTLSSNEAKEYGALRTLDGGLNNNFIYKGLPESGIYSFELKSEVISYDLPDNEAVLLIYSILLKSNDSDYRIMVYYPNNSFYEDHKRTLIINMIKITNDVYSTIFKRSYQYSGLNQKLGFYFNQNTNQIGLIINGINQGYVANINDKLNQIGFFMSGGFPPFAANSSNLGKVLSQEFIFDHSQLSSGYPVGTKDICGNPL
ncbi:MULTISPECIES: DUF4882 family protein [Acinetobacter]|uniref:DUF4882 domain-containing protein n=1 Tax=Acinetobacter baylyi (strain ATCC 33305 / BD413 / ADP1) TaxID=62977 RepID=Q6FE24_ACIAD|nr:MULTISPECIES: DUF4882 family protein [Acinetobacter]ENV55724.1 hypothetical protein F952_00352 [Acinetobacter baylyi DSM 14961 = CIP 107474]KAF2371466.1 DUF4882 domain-containing protein [Acinetobacter baylyi]KAF2373507.1 DUF4882 domain-containing protein [Acinetobacter baylyi]KAF2376646.1 DUF4882 domain-containing protein [Acinetobacter baylyi]KAF2381397.1 DUF4882 domain-containing protein [Acinetobacter baylyi]